MTSSAAPGIVRQARRPQGWLAPGPPPAPPRNRDLGPFANEDLCYLSGDWRILQRIDGHRWSLDDLLTAWVAADLAPDTAPQRILDLGCGIGAVLLMLAWRLPQATLVGIEAQAVSVELARRSVAWNGIEQRCTVRHDDLRSQAIFADLPPFDLITGTPPYFPLGTAVPSAHTQCGPCLFEERGGVEEYCAAAARFLSVNGAFVVCASALQRDRVERAADDAGMHIASELEVVPRESKPALLRVYVLRRGPTGALPRRHAALTVRDTHGQWAASFATVRREMGLPPPLVRTTQAANTA